MGNVVLFAMDFAPRHLLFRRSDDRRPRPSHFVLDREVPRIALTCFAMTARAIGILLGYDTGHKVLHWWKVAFPRSSLPSVSCCGLSPNRSSSSGSCANSSRPEDHVTILLPPGLPLPPGLLLPPGFLCRPSL